MCWCRVLVLLWFEVSFGLVVSVVFSWVSVWVFWLVLSSCRFLCCRCCECVVGDFMGVCFDLVVLLLVLVVVLFDSCLEVGRWSFLFVCKSVGWFDWLQCVRIRNSWVLFRQCWVSVLQDFLVCIMCVLFIGFSVCCGLVVSWCSIDCVSWFFGCVVRQVCRVVLFLLQWLCCRLLLMILFSGCIVVGVLIGVVGVGGGGVMVGVVGV